MLLEAALHHSVMNSHRLEIARAVTTGAPDMLLVEALARGVDRAGRGASRPAVGDWGAVVFCAPCFWRGFDDFSVMSPVEGVDATRAAVGQPCVAGMSASR